MSKSGVALLRLLPLLLVGLAGLPDRLPAAKTEIRKIAVPIVFEPVSKSADAQFVARRTDYSVFISGQGLDVRKAGSAGVQIRWLGGNPAARAAGGGRVAGVTNRYVGRDPSQWQSGLPQYERVSITGVYAGIDVVVYGAEDIVEYDFAVAAGADTRQIRLEVGGARKLQVDPNSGDLLVESLAGGSLLRQRRPHSYQFRRGKKVEIRSRYQLLGGNAVGLEFESHDRSLPLTVDPQLVFSTNFGGSGTDSAAAFAVDANFLYIAGLTYSTDFPLQSAVQTAKKGISDPPFLSTPDAYVAKINKSTKAIVYSTYIGSSDFDYINGLAVDPSGNVYVAGGTGATDFPLLNPLQSTFGGGGEQFVFKLNSAGALVYSTFLGGGGANSILGVAADASGSAYLVGHTSSNTFASATAYQARGSGADAFLAKLNPSGSAFSFTSVFGGSAGDSALAVAIDSGGNIAVVGSTSSLDFPTTAGGSLAGPVSAISFLMKFGPTASAPIFSLLIGDKETNGYQTSAQAVTVDSSSNIYVVGATSSGKLPLLNPIKRSVATSDCFLSKYTPGGIVTYATRLGPASSCKGLAVDSAGRMWVGTDTTERAPLVDPIASPATIYKLVHLYQLASDGSSILFSTMLSATGGQVDLAGLGLDPSGNLFVAGTTQPGYTTVQSLYPSRGSDAFISQIEGLSSCTFSISPTVPSTLPPAGGTQTINVTTQPGCYWNAIAYGELIFTTIPDPTKNWTEGTGSGSVTYRVSGAGRPDRSLELLIAGKGVTINQQGYGCSPSAPLLTTFPTSGGSGRASVAESGCTFAATTDVAWITLSPAASDSEIVYTVAPNGTGVARTGNLFLGTTAFPITQDGASATVSVSPATRRAQGNGAFVVFNVSSTGNWTVKANQNWLRVTFPADGIGRGSGELVVDVEPNPGPTPRTGTVTVNNQTATINQDPAISLTFDPPVLNIGPKGGTGTVSITSNSADYNWTANESFGNWLTTKGVGTGNGTFTYAVQENTAASPRSWDVSVGAFKYRVNQAAGPGLTFTPSSGLYFRPVNPCRLVDTREDKGEFGKPAMASGEVRIFRLPQAGCGVGSVFSKAYSLNVTVVPKGPLGYITLFPTGYLQPFVSTLNSVDGRVKANAAIVPAGVDGSISVYTTDATELVIDINGEFVEAAHNEGREFHPVKPCRIADTRDPNGPFGGPVIPKGGVRTFPMVGPRCGIPPSARAFSINATVVAKGPLGYITLFGAQRDQPFVSTLNAPKGGIVANAAMVVGGNGEAISVFASDETHLVLDVNGYFSSKGAEANPQRFYPVPPCRLLDTREATGDLGGPILAPGQGRSFPVRSANCLLPAGATSYSLNATVVPQAVLGYLTLWPAGETQPFVSTLNAIDDKIVANAAIVPVGSLGAVSAFATEATHLVLDTNGYFAP